MTFFDLGIVYTLLDIMSGLRPVMLIICINDKCMYVFIIYMIKISYVAGIFAVPW